MQGKDSITLDFATIVYRLQLLGFNSVRLPFSFQNLYGGSVRDWSTSCNTDTQATIVQATTDPSATANGATPPTQANPPPQTQGVCNDYLPNDTVLNRFLYVIRFFAQNGFYVLIDNHLNLDPTAVQNPTGWVQNWKDLMTSIVADPLSSAYVLVDILNEPDSQNLRWEAQSGLPGVMDLYLNAMDAITSVKPSQLMLIEGLGQVGQALCWGKFYLILASET